MCGVCAEARKNMKKYLFTFQHSVYFLFPGGLLLVLAVSLFFTMPMPVRAGSVHSFNSGMNCYGVYKLPDTGQTVHYSVATGDDAQYRPVVSQPGYTVLAVGGGFVTVDNVTKLMWITNPVDAGVGGTYNWTGAIAACEGLAYAGYSDWRLPNLKDLLSIMNYQNMNPAVNVTAFPGTQNDYYWTSTTCSNVLANVWIVNFALGGVSNSGSKGAASNYVRCVRGGL